MNFDPKATKSVWKQILKMAIGIGIALLLKSAPKWIFGEDLIIVKMNILNLRKLLMMLIYLIPRLLQKIDFMIMLVL